MYAVGGERIEHLEVRRHMLWDDVRIPTKIHCTVLGNNVTRHVSLCVLIAPWRVLAGYGSQPNEGGKVETLCPADGYGKCTLSSVVRAFAWSGCVFRPAGHLNA